MYDQPLTYTNTNGEKEGTTVLTLSGPLTLNNIFTFQSDLRSLQPPCLIVDLTLVPYMDSAGLGVLMNAYVSAQNRGHRFFLVGLTDRVRAILETTKVDTILTVFKDLPTAQAAV